MASDNGQNGRYSGNYLNWIYFHATEEERAGLPQTTRIQVLKQVLCQIIDQGSSQLNFGLTTFQLDHGGNIVAKCGTNPTSIKASINGLTANAWTPLGEAMETIVDYWAYDGPDAAIQSHCQYSFNLVITDGLPTIGTWRNTGVILATGHHRNGILLAPATAQAVADLVEGVEPQWDLRPFNPGR